MKHTTFYRFNEFNAYVRKENGHILFLHKPSGTFGSCALRPDVPLDTAEWVRSQYQGGNYTRLSADQFQNYLRG